MHLELALAVTLVPGLARLIGVLDGGAVLEVLPSAPGGDRRPEIIEHVAVESDTLAGFEPDRPYAHALALGQQLGTDAAVRLAPLLLEFLNEPLRPRLLLGTNGRFVHHGQGHR